MSFPIAPSASLPSPAEKKNDPLTFFFATPTKDYGFISSLACIILAGSATRFFDKSTITAYRGIIAPALATLSITSVLLHLRFLDKRTERRDAIQTLFNLCAKHMQRKDIPLEMLFLEGSHLRKYLETKIHAISALLRITPAVQGQQQLKNMDKVLNQLKKNLYDHSSAYSLLPASFALGHLRKSIDQCAIGESVYIHGGTRYHTVIYRVWRRKTGYYFCIYNAGAGAHDSIYHFHPSGSHTDKMLYPLYARALIRVQNKEDIQDEKFLKILLDNNQTSMKDVYLKIEQHFTAKNAHVMPKTKRDFHRLQTIGSCAVTNLQIASHDVITDKDVRRALKLQEILYLVEKLGGQKTIEQQCPSLWAIVQNKMAILREKLENKEKHASQPVKDVLNRAISFDALAPLPKKVL